MFITNCNYQYTADAVSPFTVAHKHQKPITHIAQMVDCTVFTTENEIFKLGKSGVKKIGNTSSKITTFVAHDNLIHAGCKDGSIRIFGEYRKCIREYDCQFAPIISISQIDENRIAAASENSKIFFYRINEEKQYDRIMIYDGQINSLCATNEYLVVSVSSESEEIRIYSMGDKKETTRIKTGDKAQNLKVAGNKVYFSALNKLNYIDLTTIRHIGSDANIGSDVNIGSDANIGSDVNIGNDVNIKTVVFTKNIITFCITNGVTYSAFRDGQIRSTTLGLVPIGAVNIQDTITDFSICEDAPAVVVNGTEIQRIRRKKAEEKPQIREEKRKAYEDEIEYTEILPGKRRLDKIDGFLRYHSYKRALELSFEQKSISMIYKVLEYAGAKKVLAQVVKDCDDQLLESILCFLVDHFHVREFQGFIFKILELLMETYEEKITASKRLHELIALLSDKLDKELEYQSTMLSAISFLESFS